MNWHEIHLQTMHALTGMTVADSARIFLQPIRVTIDPDLAHNRTYQWAAWFAVNLLSRSFPNTYANFSIQLPLPIHPTGILAAFSRPVVTLHFGRGTQSEDLVIANCHDWHICIDDDLRPDPQESWNPILALLTGSYAASRVTNVLLGCRRERWRPFSILDFRDATASFDWDAPLRIGNVHLAGVGAVGTAALYAMAVHARATGALALVDHDQLDTSNLRYSFFTEADLSQPKVSRAALRLRQQCPNLQVLAIQERFEDYFDRSYAADPRFRIPRLLSAPDQRATRRAFQGLLPRELWDASTGPDQVILHHNSYTKDNACAACIYAPIQVEDAHERHVAAALHLPLEHIKSRRPIAAEDAVLIHNAYPHLPVEELLGRAFDSVFRQLCDGGSIRIESLHILAPLPFISALAGVMLYFEFVKTLAPELARFQTYNYTHLNPRGVPNPDFRLLRPSIEGCDCQRPEVRRTFENIWNAA